MKESNEKVKWVPDEVQEIVDTILAGTAEQAEEVLKGFRGYRPIPGINMMTGYQVAKLSRSGMKKYTVAAYASRVGVPHCKGKWETDIDGIYSISDYLKGAGIDCEPSEGMKMVGFGPRNSRVNLYDPRGVLAILCACAKSRHRVEGKVRRVYGLETVVETPTEIIPAPQTAAVEFTPEFLAQLVKLCVTEAVSAAMAAKR